MESLSYETLHAIKESACFCLLVFAFREQVLGCGVLVFLVEGFGLELRVHSPINYCEVCSV